MMTLRHYAWVGMMMSITGAALGAETPYDPLAVAGAELAAPVDLTVVDEERSRREIPIRVFLPASREPAPVVVFSHGLGGGRDNPAYLGRHWAARGYAVIYLQHAGSDDGVWRGKPFGERMAALRAALNVENFRLRVADVPAALDALNTWNSESGHVLSGRLDLKHVGMCGHSFGAATTQALGGQRFPAVGAAHADERIRAALMFSPNSPRSGISAREAFGGVTIPWMLMTGTEDTAPVGEQTVASRLEVFPALPAGSKYELVLDGATHSAFGDRPLPGDRLGRNPRYHRAILALGAAFWDAYLRDDPAARAWLDGDRPRGVLAETDRWQRK